MSDHSARVSMYVQLPPKVAKFGSVQLSGHRGLVEEFLWEQMILRTIP